MPRPNSRNRLFLLVLLTCAAAAGIGTILLRQTPVPTSVRAPTPRAFRPGQLDPAILSRFLDFEQRAARADADLWAPERLAEAYEETFIQFWDRLRSSPDRMGDLAAFPLNTISLPQLGSPTRLEHGIQQRGSTQARRALDAAAWRAEVRALRERGWAIDGIELRMPAFTPPGPATGAQATLTFEIHAVRAEPIERAILRGTLTANWHPPRPGGELSSLQEIRIERCELLLRPGPPPFVKVVHETLQAPAGSINIDPLVVIDLDQDGRDDVCLVGRNLVYRNLPGGLRREKLFAADDILLSAAIAGDFNGDRHLDMLGADGGGLVVFWGDGSGRFPQRPVRQGFAKLENPWVMTSGDIDRDGDLDLWIAQYKVPYLRGQLPVPYHDANDGFPSFLLLNEGQGRFVDATNGSGLEPKRFRRTYSASWIDLDLDGDLDLVNVADFAGVDIYLNETRRGGPVRFRDATSLLPVPKLFGMAHAIADFDGNARPDLLAIGMNSPVADRLDSLGLGRTPAGTLPPERAAMVFGNRLWLNLAADRFETPPWARSISRTGWSWGVCAEDFDNNGTLDLYIVNGHKSHASARDYETRFWTHDIAYATSTNTDPALAVFFDAQATRYYGRGDSYGGHQRNQFFLRGADGVYVEIAWLFDLALPADCRNLSAADLDNDGRLDLIVTGVDFNRQPANHELMVYRNLLAVPPGLSISLPPGAGAEAAGPPVTLEFASGASDRRWPLTGSSYRSQGPQKVHFGLGIRGVPVRAWRGNQALPIR